MSTKEPAPYTDEETRWNAVVQRDRQADGAFVYGVATTGIYCRPGCPSKLPNRENVRFFDTWEEAERAGFRPCKRCSPSASRPPAPHLEIIRRACRLIEDADEPPTLQALADTVGLSPAYFHRRFKEIVGVTPKQYAVQQRINRMQGTLQASPTVTEAIYASGFASSSRFYADATQTLGMHPSDYRNKGAGIQIRFATVPCYLGWLLVAATAKGICAIIFADTPEDLEKSLQARFPKAEFTKGDSEFTTWVAQVLDFLESPQEGLHLPLDIQGTAFQRRVWAALQEIPVGETASYSDIAARIGNPKASRAVAQACAANPVAVAIPCHRVVRRDGSLGGYRWGKERKRLLLEQEAEKARKYK